MYPASNKDLNRETDSEIYFFTKAFYPLDNFSAHAVNIWGVTFPTSEHAFQWKKFSIVQPELAVRILNATSPHAVKEISDANKSLTPEKWHDERVSVMEEILTAKAKQHEDVRDILKRTGSKRIIENSPVDSFWGCGPDGKGRNEVGNIWMKIRENI